MRLLRQDRPDAAGHWRELIGSHDAIFFGAVGWPDTVPDHVSLWGSLLQFRRAFDQTSICARAPDARRARAARRPPAGRHRLLRRAREHRGRVLGDRRAHVPGTEREFAVQETVMTRVGIDRVLRFAFELRRNAEGHLTSATKSNGIAITMPYWDERFAVMA